MRRARGVVPREWRVLIWAACGEQCVYCDVPLSLKDQWHMDHIHPVSAGGQTVVSNLVASCPTCNIVARDGVFESFGAKREAVRERRGLEPAKPPVTLNYLLDNGIPPRKEMAKPRSIAGGDATVIRPIAGIAYNSDKPDPKREPWFTVTVRMPEAYAYRLMTDAYERDLTAGTLLRIVAQRYVDDLDAQAGLDAAVELLPNVVDSAQGQAA